MEDESAYEWFCEQYDGNEIAQGLIRQLSPAIRYPSDRWSGTYRNYVHILVDTGDLGEFPANPEPATLVCMSQFPAKQSSNYGNNSRFRAGGCERVPQDMTICDVVEFYRL